MLITLQDDGVVRLYPSPEDAARDVEPLDAEETFRLVFDETGHRYAIRWIRESSRGRFTVGNGEYALVRSGAVDIPALLELIREAMLVEPEVLRPWLGELESWLTSRLSGPA
jgi:hypothetical protein